MLQTPEIEELSDYFDGGMDSLAFSYQLAVLVLFVVLVLWGLASVGVFDETWPVGGTLWGDRFYFAVSIVLYGSWSMAIRSCWHVVGNAQRLLVSRHRMRKQMAAITPLTPDTEAPPRPPDES